MQSQIRVPCIVMVASLHHISRNIVTIHPFLSLNHKSVCFTLPLINKDRVQFKLNAIDFLNLPASKSKDVIVERTNE